ncbi:MAG TPA: ABC transporter substrate-binding protein [Candidatus Nanopelagicales bacterium]|nr:ABC transporter substrate-binding protein [Candidatus Nanopelagicales bacterium]
MSRLQRAALLVPAAVLLFAGCAAPSSTTEPPVAPTGSGSPSAGPALDCSPDTLALVNPGTLTISTSKPAYPPYVLDDDPTSGEGFESAVAYAVADKLGFDASQVSWTYVTFEQTFAPGAKTYDFGLQQVSITPKREKAITFSTPYYAANQAVVALKSDSAATSATSIEDLQALKLGAQVGSTSLTYITDVIVPSQEPYVFNDTDGAKQALKNGTIDAIVVDLPTAFYITAAEINGSTVVGQFEADQLPGDKWGLVMKKDSPLAPCVDQALAGLDSSGELTSIRDKWLSTTVKVPYFTP